MEQICKNCKHFDPITSVCDWYDLIKNDDNWCYGFLAKEEEKKMTMTDFKKALSTFTEEELNEILAKTHFELNQRASARREELRKAFFKAWQDLENDGAILYFNGEEMYFEEVEIQ